MVEPEELEKLRTPNEKAIDVQAFMEPGKVDPAYFSGKTWYLLPDGAVAVKPYALMLGVPARHAGDRGQGGNTRGRHLFSHGLSLQQC